MPIAFGPLPILVCGPGPLANLVVDGLRLEGRKALRIDAQRLEMLDPKRIRTLILADPPDAPTLVEGILARAEPRGRLRRRATQRLILMHGQDPPPPLPVPDPSGLLRLETFAIRNRAARALLNRWPLHLGMDPRFGQRPHLLIAGFADPAQAILVHALRLIQYGTGRPRISVVCANSDAVAAAFLDAYPQAPEVADIRFGPIDDLANMLHEACSKETRASTAPQIDAVPVTLAVVCFPDAAGEAVETVRQLARDLADIQGVSPPILFEIGLAHEVGSATARGGIADWDGQIIPVSYLREVCRASVLLDGRGDEVARTIHDHYRDSIAAQGRDPNLEPAGQPWELLATSYRQANRHQADHVWAKLAVTDARAVPEEMVESFVLTPLEVERLAIIEHERWAADRHLDGWSYAPVRNNQLKHHPQLIPYADLSEPMKDLDRFAVRGLPTLLARQGLGILRLLIVGLPEPAAGCPGGMRLRRLADQALDRLVARYPDRALVLASTLTDRRSRELVREVLDREQGVGLFLLLSRPLGQVLAELPDPHDRRDFLTLTARAERRIGLNGETDLATWLSERADISLILGDRVPAGVVEKRVRLDPGGLGLDWNFEY
ncbi:RyR domain-containing protein [Thiocapsa rosea]|uniref:RyR domain-containing protein n=1 Tax=Thiocapsa rosea TaxID=69360 RepID=A0A495V9G3_9GAMM|nr:RyR domain-containing protein [Thiocapsa rosea]RKT45007.1 RyR domain-containing protein [Thiocapsa rosea]